MNELDASTFPLAGHKVIEASAGTGKTYTITNLYLRLLLGESKTQKRLLRVNEILVLTFTNAATDELRRKIRERIIIARDLFREPDVVTSDIFLTHLRSVAQTCRPMRRSYQRRFNSWMKPPSLRFTDFVPGCSTNNLLKRASCLINNRMQIRSNYCALRVKIFSVATYNHSPAQHWR